MQLKHSNLNIIAQTLLIIIELKVLYSFPTIE